MFRIMPESWHMIQGVGLGATACVGWKLAELAIAGAPKAFAWGFAFASAFVASL